MPRVLHLRTVTGHGGGPEKTLLASARFLTDNYCLKLAYIRPAGDPLYDLPERALRLGVPLVDIPERGPIDPRTVLALAKELRTARPDLLHAHDYKTNLLAVLLGRYFRIPVVTTVHGYVTLGGRLDLYYRVDRWALRRMHHVIAVSEDLVHFAEALGIPRHRCSLVENAIDCQQFRRTSTAHEAKQRIGVAPERLVIGAVGRLSGEKGFDVLIRAVDVLLKEGHDVELLLAGEGECRGDLESLIESLGRQDRIRLLGHRSDIMDLFQAMDLFVLSSLREGLPNVLLEAMALEVPVLATRIAGIPRLIRDGENGLLVEAGSVEQLVDGIRRALRGDDARGRLAAAARSTIEQSYSFEMRMRKIQAIYDQVLSEMPSEANRSSRPRQEAMV